MKKIFLSLSIVFLLVSCTTQKTVRTLTYELGCSDCGNSKDGYVKIDINRNSYPDDFMVLSITNNKDEILLLEEKMFCLSYNDTLVMNPIGFVDPYETSSSTRTETRSRSKLYFNNDYYSSYFAGESGSQNTVSHTYTNRFHDFLAVPPNSTIRYFIRSILDNKYELMIIANTHYLTVSTNEDKVTDWDKVKSGLLDLNNDSFKIAIAYKLSSEEKWRTGAISLKPKNVRIEKTIVKK